MITITLLYATEAVGAQMATIMISDGITSYDGVVGIPLGVDVQTWLNANSAALWQAFKQRGGTLAAADITMINERVALIANKADTAIADTGTTLDALQPVPWAALTTADKTELIRTTLIKLLQYDRAIIRWLKQQAL